MKKAEPGFRLFYAPTLLSDYAVPANPTYGLPFNHYIDTYCIDTSSNRSRITPFRLI